MIKTPLALTAILLLIETVVLAVSGNRKFSGLFKFVPAVFWIYFLPMVFSTAGVIPAQSPVYGNISAYLLPASLVLLFLGANIPAILGLGRYALTMMLAGSFGVVLTAPLILVLFGKWLPAQAWSGFAALSGSWVGGSANMLAAKEALHTPDNVFLPMLVVDVVVSYSWMGILIALSNVQAAYDRWNSSERQMIDELREKVRATSSEDRGISFLATAGMLLLAGGMTMAAIFLSGFLPSAAVFSRATWVILTVSIGAVFLSLTPLKKLQSLGASRVGYWILYFVLTSMGAKANLRDLAGAPYFVLAGFAWVFCHFLFMLTVARIIRAPLALTATASQANIGGPVSAPIVGAVYEPALAPVGLLLGVFGNLIGTYAALLCARLCYLARPF